MFIWEEYKYKEVVLIRSMHPWQLMDPQGTLERVLESVPEDLLYGPVKAFSCHLEQDASCSLRSDCTMWSLVSNGSHRSLIVVYGDAEGDEREEDI